MVPRRRPSGGLGTVAWIALVALAFAGGALASFGALLFVAYYPVTGVGISYLALGVGLALGAVVLRSRGGHPGPE